MMNVKLINYTPEPIRTIACAGKLCYSNKVDIDSLWESITAEEADKFVNKLISSHHFSPLEMASFTFAVEGISRSCQNQLVRHRIGASYNVRSQRYCKEDNFEVVTPTSIANNAEAKHVFDTTVDVIQAAYNVLIDQYNIPKEDARAVLPNACCTRMLVTMNARELLHFFSERCCNRAQSELRTLAYKMLILCKEVAPALFANAGAKCDQIGYCPEGKMSCGRKPTLGEIKNAQMA
jgi:thymidylate synthase (FAD)